MDTLPEQALDGTGLVALVTGGNTGIGYAIADQLLDRGLSLWIGSRDLGRGQEAAGRLGRGARVVQLDVTDDASVAAAAGEVGALDVLVNNAGINPGGEDVRALDLDQVRRAYATNVFGLIAVTQAFLPALDASAHPRIVNIGSGTGSLGWSTGPNPSFDWTAVRGGGLAYRSSKTAVQAVTLHTAQALGDRCKVNVLAPGLRRTDLLPGMDRGGDPAEGAAGAVRLALLPDDGPTGGFWSFDGTRVPW